MRWLEIGNFILDFHYVIYVEKVQYPRIAKWGLEVLLANNELRSMYFDSEQERDDIFENIRFNVTHEPDLF